MRFSLALVCSLAACSSPTTSTGPSDAGAADLGRLEQQAPPHDLAPAVDIARSSDLAPTYEDLLQPPAPDLALAPDMVTPPDLSPAPDLTPPPACGGLGQPCCSGTTCSTIPWVGGPVQLVCVYTGDICSAARPSTCTNPVNCGYGGLPCCDSQGRPASVGYCKAGDRCQAGKCLACP